MKKLNYVYAIGKRRTSSARVRLFKGSEENTVNGQLVGKYFPGEIARSQWGKPMEILEVTGKYFFTARIIGGGKQGQLEALVHAISRALAKAKAEYRKPLKSAKLLKRDSRIRERRKMGTGGKARRKKQSPKR